MNCKIYHNHFISMKYIHELFNVWNINGKCVYHFVFSQGRKKALFLHSMLNVKIRENFYAHVEKVKNRNKDISCSYDVYSKQFHPLLIKFLWIGCILFAIKIIKFSHSRTFDYFCRKVWVLTHIFFHHRNNTTRMAFVVKEERREGGKPM